MLGKQKIMDRKKGRNLSFFLQPFHSRNLKLFTIFTLVYIVQLNSADASAPSIISSKYENNEKSQTAISDYPADSREELKNADAPELGTHHNQTGGKSSRPWRLIRNFKERVKDILSKRDVLEIKTETPPQGDAEQLSAKSSKSKDCSEFVNGELVRVRKHGDKWTNGDDECEMCGCDNGDTRCYVHYCNGPGMDYITPPSEVPKPPTGNRGSTGDVPLGNNIGDIGDYKYEDYDYYIDNMESSGMGPHWSDDEDYVSPPVGAKNGNHVVYLEDYEDPFSHRGDKGDKSSKSDCIRDCSLLCPYGFKLTPQNFGCPSCKCLKCSPIPDCTDCPQGYAEDARGCRICACHPPTMKPDKPLKNNSALVKSLSPAPSPTATNHFYQPPSNRDPHNHFYDNSFDILKEDELSILRDDDSNGDSRMEHLLDDVTTLSPNSGNDLNDSEPESEKAIVGSEKAIVGSEKAFVGVIPSTTEGWRHKKNEEEECTHTVPHGCPDPDGLVHRVGSSWRKDPCTVCRCLSRGYSECTVTKCSPKSGARDCRPPAEGECCPRCQEAREVSSHLPFDEVNAPLDPWTSSGEAIKKPLEADITSIFLVVIGLVSFLTLVGCVAIHYYRRYHSDKYDITGRISPEEAQRLRPVKVNCGDSDTSSLDEPLKNLKCV